MSDEGFCHFVHLFMGLIWGFLLRGLLYMVNMVDFRHGSLTKIVFLATINKLYCVRVDL